MSPRIVSSIAVIAGLAAAPALAQDRVDVGMLECNVEGATSFVIGSTRELECKFTSAGDGMEEHFIGEINRFGLDIGTTEGSTLYWAVSALATDFEPGALEGSYIGVSSEASLGAGVGSNALIGGFTESVALQPVSVQQTEGVNLALGVAELTLTSTDMH
ncbi:MAG: DUF992 domain-containing protein [Azospirillaceae bacterium]